MSFRTPKYRLHKGSGQALVQINGERIYLGKYGSAESEEKYKRLVAEYLSSGQSRKPGVDGVPGQRFTLSVNDLILAFWQHAKQRYLKNGHAHQRDPQLQDGLTPSPAAVRFASRSPDFGPLALVACRLKLIEAGICRKRINQHVGRIRQMFKWGVGREMVPETRVAGPSRRRGPADRRGDRKASR